MSNCSNSHKKTIYLLAGKRQGFDLSGLKRIDDDDGYSRFLRKDGSCQAVVRTDLLWMSE